MKLSKLASGLLVASSMPAGASTTLEDIIGPRGDYIPVVESFMVQDPVERTAFFQSGVLQTGDPRIQAVLDAAAVVASVPFWEPISADVEPNYSNDVYEDVAVPRAVSTGIQMARIAYLNEGFSAMSLVQAITKQDPLAYVASVLDNFWERQYQRRLIATALGIYNSNVAQDAGDMVTNAGGPFTLSAFIDATAQMGDTWLDGLGVVAMPRAVYTQMQKANLIDYVEDTEQKIRIPTYQGHRVVVDNGMPVITGTPNKALVILFAPGAIGYASGQPDRAQEYERQAARGNGGGVDTLWSRRDVIMHPLGFSFLSTTITGNGTETRPASAGWTDLALAANWDRVMEREQIPMAFLTVNLA